MLARLTSSSVSPSALASRAALKGKTVAPGREQFGATPGKPYIVGTAMEARGAHHRRRVQQRLLVCHSRRERLEV